MWTCRIKYAKRGRIRFISHLDVMRALTRSFHRAGLPLVYKEGFNPRPKMAMGPALPLGYESESEFADITLAERVAPESVVERLSKALPAGLDLLAVEEVVASSPRLSSASSTVYMIQLKRELTETIEADIAEFLSKDSAPVERVRKDMSDIIDVKRFVTDLRMETRADLRWLRMEISTDGRGSCSAAEVAQAVLRLSPDKAKCLHIVRTEIRFHGRPRKITDAKEQEEESQES